VLFRSGKKKGEVLEVFPSVFAKKGKRLVYLVDAQRRGISD